MIEFEIVQDRKTLVGMHHEIHLDTRAETHGVENAGRREFGVRGFSPRPVPLDEGPVTLVVEE
ncbi:MAG: hypothetical protein U5N27_23825 [Rhizobium sp.]|nr:hypothetical protein [Rhizobium sp.]